MNDAKLAELSAFDEAALEQALFDLTEHKYGDVAFSTLDAAKWGARYQHSLMQERLAELVCRNAELETMQELKDLLDLQAENSKLRSRLQSEQKTDPGNECLRCKQLEKWKTDCELCWKDRARIYNDGITERAQLSATCERMRAALEFYADPGIYHAIVIFPDRPCGEFINDFSECEDEDLGTVTKPGKRARKALESGERGGEG